MDTGRDEKKNEASLTDKDVKSTENEASAAKTTPDLKDKHFSGDIIDKLKAFGYKVDEGGLCNGLTLMWSQAVLAQDTQTFFDRLRIIYNSSDLPTLVKETRKKVSEHKSLSPDEYKILDIPAFMEGVSIYQLPEEYTEFFDKELDQKKVEQISPFTASAALEAQQAISSEDKKVEGVKEVFNLEITDKNEQQWTTYFDNLREVFKKQTANLSIVISTYNHKMGLSYDSKTDSWDLFDQQLVDFKKGITTKKIPHDKFGKEVMDIFSRNEIDNRLMTRIYSTPKTFIENPKLIEEFNNLKTLKEQITTKNLFEDQKKDAVDNVEPAASEGASATASEGAGVVASAERTNTATVSADASAIPASHGASKQSDQNIHTFFKATKEPDSAATATPELKEDQKSQITKSSGAS